MSGLLSLASGPDILAMLRRRWPESDVILASDAVTALAGAFGINGGVVVAVGTGVVGLGTDFRDTWRRVDGWGHLLGDDGGGAWIGERGLRAALKAHDGRSGGSAPLLAALRDEFGEPESLPRSIYSTGRAASLLASFATAVARAAEDGDAVAADIWHEAGIALAQTALAGFAPGIPRRVAVVGGLTKAGELLRRSLLAELSEHRPDVSLVFGATSPLHGSVALARIALETPQLLASHPPYLTYAPRRRRP